MVEVCFFSCAMIELLRLGNAKRRGRRERERQWEKAMKNTHETTKWKQKKTKSIILNFSLDFFPFHVKEREKYKHHLDPGLFLSATFALHYIENVTFYVWVIKIRFWRICAVNLVRLFFTSSVFIRFLNVSISFHSVLVFFLPCFPSLSDFSLYSHVFRRLRYGYF